ncbi:hypothetical protein KAR91_03925 [Candidatus Pacearchaeota archaeon]|nr:hypothetical protein [Candidatus Pacearchaeota archaeon]
MGLFDQTQHKKGDKVVCLTEKGNLKKGKKYTITKGNYGQIFQDDYVDIEGEGRGFYANRFEKIKEL